MNWLPTTILCLVASSPSALSQPSTANHATPILLKETRVAESGKTIWLALVFKIDKDWHIYWDGHNDTGTPPTFRASLPEGWTIGRIQWPVPERHTSEGDIVDYIYDKEVTLLVSLDVPANAAVGEVHEINLDLNWLACSNVCVPEKAPVKTSVRVGPPGSAETLPYTIERFAAARASLPKKVDSLEGVTDAGAVGNDSFRASVKDGQLLITAKSADRLVFMPASTGAPLANALVEGEVKGETLRAAIGESDAKFISGIVQIWKGKTQENYRIELPLLVPQGNAPASKIVEPRTPPQIP